VGGVVVSVIDDVAVTLAAGCLCTTGPLSLPAFGSTLLEVLVDGVCGLGSEGLPASLAAR